MSYTLGGMKKAVASALTVLAAVAVTGSLSGCSSSPSATAANPDFVVSASLPAPERVGAADFAKVVATPGVQIIDVRTPAEFADGHLAGAVNIPMQRPDFMERVAQLDPKATYAVYCRSGSRSKSAVAQMQGAGITHIYELATGTNGWTAAGFNLTQ